MGKTQIYRMASSTKTKIGVVLSGGVIAAAMALGGGVSHATIGGPVCNVPADYPTIQAAVSVPTCTTVNVASGTYNENVAVTHSLTLNGAKAGKDARARSSVGESIINGGILATVTINADGVTVDGFTLDGPVSQGTAAIVMMGANVGETIQNNIINNPGRAASFNTSNTVFSKNLVNGTSTSGDGFQANSSPVHDVTFYKNNFGGAPAATYNADITIIEGNSNITVSRNKSTGDGTLVALFKTNGAHITGNTVIGAGGSSAIYVGGANSNVTVSGNKVTSAGSAVKVANSFGDGPNSTVNITWNTLHNNTNGVYVGPASASGTVVARRNSLTGNSAFGIFNDPASGAVTNGTCNWWGASNGPGPVGAGSGDKVSSGVNFTPWLESANLRGNCGDKDHHEDDPPVDGEPQDQGD